MFKKGESLLVLTLLVIFASIIITNAQEVSIANSFRFPLEGDWSPLWQDFNKWNNQWNGYHLGEDVGREEADKKNYAVYPMADGIVKFADIVMGYTVIIEHKLSNNDPDGDYVCSVYYHMKRPEEGGIKLRLNEVVYIDNPIGYVSSKWEDHKSSPHLHFGIRRGRYKIGKDPRTGFWYYPGYTVIKKAGEVQKNPNDPIHKQILEDWFNPSTDPKNGTGFIERHITQIEQADEISSTKDYFPLAEEVVRLASSQINKTKGDGKFTGLIWADAYCTYCERFVSAVITVASGKKISEQKVKYSTAITDYFTRCISSWVSDQPLCLLKESEEPPKGAVVYFVGSIRGDIRGDLENCYGGYVGISDGKGNVIGAINATQGVLSKPIKSFEATGYGWIFPEEWDIELIPPPKVGKDLPKTFSKKGVSIMLVSVEAFPPPKKTARGFAVGSYLSETHIAIRITNNTYNRISTDLSSGRIVADGQEFRIRGYGNCGAKPGATAISGNISFAGIPANINKITIYIPYIIYRPSWEKIEAEFEVEFY